MTLEEAVKLFHGFEFEERIHEARLEALDAIGAVLCGEAKRLIGTAALEDLKPATQRDRERQGFAPNEPLLRTGELRDAIEYQVVSDHEVQIGIPEGLNHSGSGATVGEIGLWQEIGTATIPPRPFLAGAAARKGQECADLAGYIVGAAVAGARADAEIIHLAIESLKRLGELGKHLVENDEENRNERH